MNLKNINMYALLASSLLFIDRLSKHIVMYSLPHYQVSPFFSIDLVFNRGISFGLFHSQNVITFTAVNIFIGCVISWLAAHTYARIVNGKCIVGEIFIFAGAISNAIDRCVHGGVVDFIAFSFKNWHFAVFNIADAFIFCGVMIMLFVEYRESCRKV
jgi:signal peptidase II